jgi:hypothetical protein
MIAALAAGDQIIPRRLATARPWHYVIEGQLGRRELLSAILTARMIAQQDVLPRQRTTLKRNVAIFGKTDYRRRVHLNSLRMQHVAIVLFHTRDAFENHHHRTPLSAHVDGLKGGVQD